MRPIACILLLLMVRCALAQDVPPPAPQAPNPVATLDATKQERVNEATAFLSGEVKKQFADLQIASKDPAVKALYAPFLTPSLTDLTASHYRSIQFKKRRASSYDQIPKPLSYSALKTAGALDDPGVWFGIAVHKKNDRPRGRYTPFRTEDERKRYRTMHVAFVLLADFWVQDATLAP